MADPVVEELSHRRLGRTVKGKWRLDRLIGVGGMAAVYAATHRNGARVALKMLHATISASSTVRARFVREGYLANKVDHAGVVRVLDDDVDDSDGAAFLVMDLIEGVTLADRAMERLLDDGEVLDVAAQVLSVLVAAHDKGIVHRDLKPDNLLVDRDGKVHVLDFGIARMLDDAGWASATKTGTAFGTPGFMAPEQAMGKTQLVNAQTDIYALGATLFALVCGDFVHAAENPQELMVLVATQEPRSLGELAPHMHPDVVAIIDKATRTRQEERWASARAMLAAVDQLRDSLGTRQVRVLPVDQAPAQPNPMPRPVSLAAIERPKTKAPSVPPPDFGFVGGGSGGNSVGAPSPLVVSPTPTPGGVVPSAEVGPLTMAPITSVDEAAPRKPRRAPLFVVLGLALLLGGAALAVRLAQPDGKAAAGKDDGDKKGDPKADKGAEKGADKDPDKAGADKKDDAPAKSADPKPTGTATAAVSTAPTVTIPTGSFKPPAFPTLAPSKKPPPGASASTKPSAKGTDPLGY